MNERPHADPAIPVRTVAACLQAAADQLAVALTLERREARLEARVLAAFAWGVNPAWLISHDTDIPSEGDLARFDALVGARLTGTPVAYLTGSREFYGRLFRVSPDVLIPRPDTERLVELALERLPRDRAVDVLDLGTGSGCIAITVALERPLARVTAIDRAPAALATASSNAHALRARLEFLVGNWFEPVATRRFDLIVSNPPYIAASDPHLTRGDVRFEPSSALVAGPDGLTDLRQLVAAAGAHLKPGGALLLEHGYDQADAVQALLQNHGFLRPETWTDLSGNPRVTGGKTSE